MLLYHGSDNKVVIPKMDICRPTTDFGKGFYTTTSEQQARKWALIKKERANTAYGYISVFDFDESILSSDVLKIMLFKGPTRYWLDFVVNNRMGKPLQEYYDIVEGPVANDKLYATITLYEQGILTADACIEQLQTYKLFDQLSFHTDAAIKTLSFQKFIKV